MRQLTLFNDLILTSKTEPDEAKELLFELKKRGPVIGTDEAGRGSLAGPMVAAAVFLTQEQEEKLLSLKLRDSKKMTAMSREKLFEIMCELDVMWRVQFGTVKMIERDNILQTSLWAMGKCAFELSRELSEQPVCVIVDGPERITGIKNFSQWPLIAADNMIPVVSAASVVAKVVRDRLMQKLDKIYPGYLLAHNKGYPTPAHREAVMSLGLSKIHRPSFCRKFLEGR